MKKKKYALWKLILILIPALILGGAAAVLLPLHINYTKTSYERVKPVEAPEGFTSFEIPEYPELEFEPPEHSASDAGEFLPPDEAQGVPGSPDPKKPAEDGKPETSPETEPAAEPAAETSAGSGTEATPAETEAEPKPETEAAPETEAKSPETEAKAEAPAPDPGTSADPAPAGTAGTTAGTAAGSTSGNTTGNTTGTDGGSSAGTASTPPASYQTGQVLPKEENAAPTVVYNTNASFSDPGAVSVYGYTPIYQVTERDKNVRNILILGTDSRDVTMYRGNSDVMILLSYNKSAGTIKLVTFMRDALVPIAGHDWNRLNSAYAYDGIGLTVNTLNQLFGLDIQEFVCVDFNGTKNFIDYIGGVDISLTAEEAEYYSTASKTYAAGVNHLNGAEALRHMRNRTLGYDFGRTSRQRDTLSAVIRTIFREKSVAEIYDILNYSFGMVKTNISSTSMAALALSVASSGLNISGQQIPYSDAYQNAWYNGLEILSFDIGAAAWRLGQFLYN